MRDHKNIVGRNFKRITCDSKGNVLLGLHKNIGYDPSSETLCVSGKTQLLLLSGASTVFLPELALMQSSVRL